MRRTNPRLPDLTIRSDPDYPSPADTPVLSAPVRHTNPITTHPTSQPSLDGRPLPFPSNSSWCDDPLLFAPSPTTRAYPQHAARQPVPDHSTLHR